MFSDRFDIIDCLKITGVLDIYLQISIRHYHSDKSQTLLAWGSYSFDFKLHTTWPWLDFKVTPVSNIFNAKFLYSLAISVKIYIVVDYVK